MTAFLLIHGSAHGAWCWDRVVPLLQGAGHDARAIDLPGHGTDQTPAALVTLDMYAGKIRAALSEPTVLVAHSMGGYPAALAAALSPHLVRQIIYLCAHVPVPGKSIAKMRALAPTQPLAAATRPSADGKTVTFDRDLARDRFYHDVEPALADWALDRLCPQPVLPQTTPFPAVPARPILRHYIRCMADRAIPPAYQVERTADWPEGTVSSLATSHSPFLSAPETLAARIIDVTGAVA